MGAGAGESVRVCGVNEGMGGLERKCITLKDFLDQVAGVDGVVLALVDFAVVAIEEVFEVIDAVDLVVNIAPVMGGPNPSLIFDDWIALICDCGAGSACREPND